MLDVRSETSKAVDTHINRQVAVKIIRSGATAYPNEEAKVWTM